MPVTLKNTNYGTHRYDPPRVAVREQVDLPRPRAFPAPVEEPPTPSHGNPKPAVIEEWSTDAEQDAEDRAEEDAAASKAKSKKKPGRGHTHLQSSPVKHSPKKKK